MGPGFSVVEPKTNLLAFLLLVASLLLLVRHLLLLAMHLFLLAFLLLVVWPGAPSSFLFLVVMPLLLVASCS